jgi:cysteinyl-tRNA synthetase
MSEMELGLPFDIHGGATDLIFPHHENELAQSEAATGQPFVRYWMHGGLLQVNAEKMSKSLGNFLLLKEVLERYPAAVVRLLMLQTHYRSPLDFSTERLDEASIAFERLANTVRSLTWAASGASGPGMPQGAREALSAAIDEAHERFDAEMDDDFNSAGALGAVFELARLANGFACGREAELSPADAEVVNRARETVIGLLAVLGVNIAGEDESALPEGVIDVASQLAGYTGSDRAAAVDALLELRARARSEKDWSRADAVRDGLAALGVRVEDTATGARVCVLQD